MFFAVDVIVEIDDTIRPDHLKGFKDPVAYAKQFVTLSPATHGNHLISKGGLVATALKVVDCDARLEEAFVI